MNKAICPNIGSYTNCSSCPHRKPHEEYDLCAPIDSWEKRTRGNGGKFPLCKNSKCTTMFEYYMKEIVRKHEEKK